MDVSSKYDFLYLYLLEGDTQLLLLLPSVLLFSSVFLITIYLQHNHCLIVKRGVAISGYPGFKDLQDDDKINMIDYNPDHLVRLFDQ